MDTPTLLALAAACAPQVDAGTVHAIVAVESGLNPHAIGVVGGRLERQPRHRAEAVATARALQAAGWNFSVGLGQINVHNLERRGLTAETAFEPCSNLSALQAVLAECYGRAGRQTDGVHAHGARQTALRRALSCYYSGNFSTGFHHGYVGRVVAAAHAGHGRPPSPALNLREAP
jgi:type IV secretion system protein VirB1